MMHTAIRIATDAFLAMFLLGMFFRHPYQKNLKPSKDLPIEFPVDQVTFWLSLIGTAYSFYWAIMAFAKIDFVSTHLLSRYIGVIAPASIGIALLFSLPGALTVTSEGIEQRFWFRPNKRVFWTEIATITVGNYRLEVGAANGQRIVHERSNLDRERFLLELKRHCTEKDFAERLDQGLAMCNKKDPVS